MCKSKDVNKSKFGSAILLLCSVPSVFALSKPVKPGHHRTLRAHILRVLLTKYGEMAQQLNNKCSRNMISVARMTFLRHYFFSVAREIFHNNIVSFHSPGSYS